MVTFRLHGVECHVCGRPADWFSDGVTMPCGCGRSRGEHRYQVRRRIQAHQKERQECKPLVPVPLSEEAQRRADQACEQAWETIAELLVALKG